MKEDKNNKMKTAERKKARPVRLIKDVKFLTAIQPARNYQNLESLKKVVEHICSVITENNFDYELQEWEADGNIYQNVICSIAPDKKKRLIVGAHYDVFGELPGADDNASAVAGLLETIRLLNENKPELDYGLDLVFYCLEEPPYFGTEKMGSYIHAESVSTNKDNIIGMICYEMIGYFSDTKGSQKFPHSAMKLLYPSKGNFIMTVGITEFSKFNNKVYKAMKGNCGIDVQKINMPLQFDLAGMSDQRNYWKFGIPAMMINDTSFMRNPHYHKPTDTIDTLDFNKMSEVINGAYNAIISM